MDVNRCGEGVPSQGIKEKGCGCCRHVWIIEMPQGPTSKGVCEICGIEKEFLNYIEEYKYGHSSNKCISDKHSLAS